MTLVDHVRQRLAAAPHGPDAPSIAQEIAESRAVFGAQSIAQISQTTHRELLGAGVLQEYLEDPRVTDVLVNDVREVWVDRGVGLERVPVDFGSSQELRSFAVRMAAQCGVRLDDSKPSADGRLANGTRFHALLNPLCEAPAVLSLRTFKHNSFTIADLVNSGSIPAQWSGLLTRIVDTQANFLISGATGTGKTTLLSALLSLVPHTERIICIEESRELRINHPHVLALETRGNNVEGIGATNQTDLLRHTLRMRPDRIVVGECRGAELREMLSALNTGHRGGCGTLHANSASDVPARLQAMGALAHMDARTLAIQVHSALDLVLHIKRSTQQPFQGQRYLAEIAVIEVTAQGELKTQCALAWAPGKPEQQGPGYRTLMRLIGDTT